MRGLRGAAAVVGTGVQYITLECRQAHVERVEKRGKIVWSVEKRLEKHTVNVVVEKASKRSLVLQGNAV